MTPPIAPVQPQRPGGPSRVIQGSFAGGRPRILQAAPAPHRLVPVASPPAVQPAIRPCAVQPPARPGSPAGRPQPILPNAARPGAAQPSGGDAFAVPPGFQMRPSALGQRLPEAVQQKMEAFFGASFADVRVHVGSEASSIGALAFTHGSNLYFAPGQYNPQTPQGQRLLGHELTHVVQQRAGRVRNPLGTGLAVVQDPPLEAEAERMGLRAASTVLPVQPKLVAPAVPRPAAPRLAAPGPGIPRKYGAAPGPGGETGPPREMPRTRGPIQAARWVAGGASIGLAIGGGVDQWMQDDQQGSTPGIWTATGAVLGGVVGLATSRLVDWFRGTPAPPTPAPPILRPVVHAAPPIPVRPLIQIRHGKRRRSVRVQPNHYRTPRELETYKAGLQTPIIAKAKAGQATVTASGVRDAINNATNLFIPMVGADLEFGLYEYTFFTILHRDDYDEIQGYENKYAAWQKGGRHPGLRPTLGRDPNPDPVTVEWTFLDRNPVVVPIAATGHGQGLAEAENSEKAFRTAMRTRFSQAAQRPRFRRNDVMTQKFIGDHVASTPVAQVHMASNRPDHNAAYNHVILLEPAEANRATWEPIIDFVGSLNIAMAIKTGVDYCLPGAHDVAEYNGSATTFVSAKVWVQFQPEDGIMKIHHLSGVEYESRGRQVYHGQVLKRSAGLPPIRKMRDLDLS